MEQLLNDKVVILDGSTGYNLIKAGMPTGVCPEKWILENPDALIELQKRYVAAGSAVIYAPTFGVNREKLKKYGLGGEVDNYNKRLVALSRVAAGGKVLVAGDMSSLGLFTQPYGDSTFDELFDIYREQAESLEAAGVDLFAAETLMTLAEGRAAYLAIRSVSDKPVICTFTFEAGGRTIAGTSAAAALVTMQALGVSAFGVNCSSGPDQVADLIESIAPYAKVPLVAKANAGLPQTGPDGSVKYNLTPEEFNAHTKRLIQNGVRFIGGCCGTDERHIAAIAATVGAFSENPPSLPESAEYLATERDIFPLPEKFDTPSHGGVEEALEGANTDCTAPVLEIKSEHDTAYFLENCCYISCPVCFKAATPELLECVLRNYNGRATVFFNKHHQSIAEKYGAIQIK